MSVTDLLNAMTALAYDDYVNGGILLKNSEYLEKNGNIILVSVKGRPIEAYTRHQQYAMHNKVYLYTTARIYFENTRLGNYLIRKGDQEIAEGHSRRTRQRREI